MKWTRQRSRSGRLPPIRRSRKVSFGQTSETIIMNIVPKSFPGIVDASVAAETSTNSLSATAIFSGLGLLISILALLAGWQIQVAPSYCELMCSEAGPSGTADQEPSLPPRLPR
jgi:hypothetical protein